MSEVLKAVKSLAGDVNKGLSDLNNRVEKIEKQPDWGKGRLAAEPIDKKLAGSHGFKTPREFLFEVMKSFMHTHEEMDPRLFDLWEPNVEKRQKGKTITKAVGSDEARAISDPYGGFLVPITFVPDLLKIDPEEDPIGGRTRNIPMATPTVKIPARADKNHTTSVSGGLTVTRRPETVAGTASQMTLENVNLETHTLFGLSYASEELLRDSPISFAALLSAGFSDQFVSHLIGVRKEATFRIAGAPTPGSPASTAPASSPSTDQPS